MLKDFIYGNSRSIERAVPSHRIRSFQREYYKAFLLSQKKRRVLGNSLRWTTESTGYTLELHLGSIPSPHIIRYSEEVIHGAQYDISDLEAPFFLCGLKGLYQVNFGIVAEYTNYVDVAQINAYLEVLGEPWIRIFKNDAVIDPSGSQFLWKTSDDAINVWTLSVPSEIHYRTVVNFADNILLERGDKVDIRMSLPNYAIPSPLILNIKSYFSIEWINDGGNLWLIQ